MTTKTTTPTMMNSSSLPSSFIFLPSLTGITVVFNSDGIVGLVMMVVPGFVGPSEYGLVSEPVALVEASGCVGPSVFEPVTLVEGLGCVGPSVFGGNEVTTGGRGVVIFLQVSVEFACSFKGPKSKGI